MALRGITYGVRSGRTEACPSGPRSSQDIVVSADGGASPDLSLKLRQQLETIAAAQVQQAQSIAAIMIRLNALPAAQIAPPPSDPLDKTLKRLWAENMIEQTKKTRIDQNLAYFAPFGTAFTVLVGFIGILIQQRLTARANLTVKALELVMSADTPFIAEARYNLLRSMFGFWPPAQFRGRFDRRRFPGLRLYELALASR